MKNLGEKGAWAYPGTAQIFGVPPIKGIISEWESYELQILYAHS